MNIYIYALCEPDQEWNIRYVGKTIHPLVRRLYGHFNKYSLMRKSYKNSWLKSLIKAGKKPIIKLIDIGDENNWQELERFYIKSYRESGFILTNSTDGGEGLHGYVMPIERRNQLSAKLTGRKGHAVSLETRAKIRAARVLQVHPNLGKTFSDERRLQMSIAHKGQVSGMKGKKHSEESKAAIREKRKSQVFTEETKAKMSAVRIGKPRPDLVKSHCKRGHEYTEDNIYTWKGHRQCKACRRLRSGNK